jgi:histidinol-phosphate phosphatase family protein
VAERGKVVILDRDGTIVIDRGYLDNAAGLEFLPGAAAGLHALYSQGNRLVVITNQSGVGRGLFPIDRVYAMNARLNQMIEEAGARLAGIYFCPHTPDESCDCRKPNLGLMTLAAAELNSSGVGRDRRQRLGHRVRTPRRREDDPDRPRRPAPAGSRRMPSRRISSRRRVRLPTSARLIRTPADFTWPPETARIRANFLIEIRILRMKISIFGSGYVGLVTGACLADAGNHVVCVDIDARKVDMLRRGEIPIHEPGLDAMVKRNVDAGRLRFTTNAKGRCRARSVPADRGRHAAG